MWDLEGISTPYRICIVLALNLDVSIPVVCRSPPVSIMVPPGKQPPPEVTEASVRAGGQGSGDQPGWGGIQRLTGVGGHYHLGWKWQGRELGRLQPGKRGAKEKPPASLRSRPPVCFWHVPLADPDRKCGSPVTQSLQGSLPRHRAACRTDLEG